MSFVKKLLASKMVKNSGWIVGGKVAQMVIAFLVGIVTARYLGPSNYGVINTAHAYTTFFFPICSLGFSGVFVKLLVDDPDQEGKYLGSGIAARTVASLVGMALMLALVIGLNPSDRTLQIVCFIHYFLLLFQSFDLFDYWYQSRYESKYASVIGTIGYAASAIYKVILLVTEQSVEWFAFATILDYAVIAAIYMTYTVRKNRIKLRVSWKTAGEMFRLSKHLILANLLVVLYGQMDKIMIGKMSSSAAVGLYSVAVAICGMWTFVLAAIINSVRPNIVQLFNTDKKAYQNRIIQLYSVIFWLCALVSLVLCLCSDFVVRILYGADYAGAAGCLRIVTWYTGFSYFGVARNIWTVCEGKQRFEKYFALAGVISNLMLNFALIPIWGIEGAALASLLTQVVTNVITPFIIKDTRENAIYVFKSLNPLHLFRVIGAVK